MKKIKLSQDKYALVDDDDYEILSVYKWYARKDRYIFYAQRKNNPNDKAILMHRVIMNPPSNMFIDHINRNGLDNRKKNLRIVTHSQNHFNEKIRIDNTSGYKGIQFNKKNKKWIAYISKKYLGSFKDIKDAIECRNIAIKHIYPN